MWRGESGGELQEVSHVGLPHINALADVRDEGRYPVVGGRPDALRAGLEARFFINAEARLLRFLLVNYGSALPTSLVALTEELLARAVALSPGEA